RRSRLLIQYSDITAREKLEILFSSECSQAEGEWFVRTAAERCRKRGCTVLQKIGHVSRHQLPLVRPLKYLQSSTCQLVGSKVGKFVENRTWRIFDQLSASLSKCGPKVHPLPSRHPLHHS